MTVVMIAGDWSNSSTFSCRVGGSCASSASPPTVKVSPPLPSLHRERLDLLELDPARHRIRAGLEVERGRVEHGAEAADGADLRAVRRGLARLCPCVERPGRMRGTVRCVCVVVRRGVGAAVEDNGVDAAAADNHERSDAVRAAQILAASMPTMPLSEPAPTVITSSPLPPSTFTGTSPLVLAT